MNIDRNNYEEYFMLYADNELSAAQRKEVEAFIAANPDTAHELELFHQFKASPDTTIVFDNKTALLKHEGAIVPITADNCESFFVLYADDELTNHEKAAVEDFVYRHPSFQETFELMQQVKLHPDAGVVFENKHSLYRKEKEDRVVPFPWLRLAAAAAIILFVLGIFWLNRGKKTDQAQVVKNQKANQVKQPILKTVNDTATVKGNKTSEPAMETIAATGAAKDHPHEKNKRVVQEVAVRLKKEIYRSNTLPVVQQPVIKEAFAVKNESTSSSISPVNKLPVEAEIKRPLIAAAAKTITDQQVTVLDPDENNTNKAVFASLNNDNVEVLNTSFNTKSSLRGFLRKASRLIAKKTNAGNEDGKHKAILIGGFEIAVQ